MSKAYEQALDNEMQQQETFVRFGDVENGNYTQFNENGTQVTYKNFLPVDNSPESIGWTPGDKEAPRKIVTALTEGKGFKVPDRVTSFSDAWAKWNSGLKSPIVFYGDSWTDGRITTTDGVTLADTWNIDFLVDDAVPDGFTHDHDDAEVPNAYPNILERMLKEYHNNSTLRCYNAGYRGMEIQDGWAVDNVYNAVYANTSYSDAEIIVFMFGINDCESASGDTLRTNFYNEQKALILDAYARGIQPALMTSGPISKTADDEGDYSHNEELNNIVNQVKRDLATEFNIELIDLNKALKGFVYSNNEAVKFTSLSDDDLHLNDLGHLKQAEFLFQKIGSENIPVVKDLSYVFDATNSASRFSLSSDKISNSDQDRGLNKIGANATLSQSDVEGAAGEYIFDLWFWNESASSSIIYEPFVRSRHDYTLSAVANFPQIEVSSRNFTAIDYYKENVYNSEIPEGFGKLPEDAANIPCLLGTLKQGLNRVRVFIPATVATAYSDGALSGNWEMSYFHIVNKAKSPTVMQRDYGLNYETQASWVNVLGESGEISLISTDITTHAQNWNMNFVPPTTNRESIYSLNDSNNVAEFKIRSTFGNATGVVLSYSLVENSNLTPAGGVSKDSIYMSGYHALMYANAAGVVRIASITSNGTASSYNLTGVTVADIAGKNIRLKIKKGVNLITVTLYDDAGVVLHTGDITDKAVISSLMCGYVGGLWLDADDATLDMNISSMQMRTYSE